MSTSDYELEQVLIATFAEEARERLRTITELSLALDSAEGTEKRALLEVILRETHSLKGDSRAVDLGRVEALAHRLEGLFSAIRSGELGADAAVLGLVHDALGGLAALVDEGVSGRACGVGAHELAVGTAPVSAIFEGLPRMVRQLGAQLSKEVELTIEGDHIEADRAVLRQLRSPLVHIVCNCVDHGIEDPEARRAAGKRRQGSVVLSASRRSAELVIEVADDGAGIDVERVKGTAVENGLISPARAHRMTEREALWLVFLSGLSTREQTTEVSGRGVGLDVVRERLERLNGAIDVQSTLGHGTRFALSVPTGDGTAASNSRPQG